MPQPPTADARTRAAGVRVGIALSVLWLAACAARPIDAAGDGSAAPQRLPAGAPVEGRGFTAFAPAGPGWAVVQRTPQLLVFGQSLPAAHARRGDGPYVLLAGVQVLPAESGDREFPDDARDWLTRRLQVPGRRLVSLDVQQAAWHHALCVRYEALQVTTLDVDDDPAARFEYRHVGRLCRHPDDAALWTHVFGNGRSPRFGGSPAGWQQAEDFADRVLLVAPRPAEGGR